MKMEDNDNKITEVTTIEYLPIEMVFEILKRIKEPNKLDNIRNVCKLWYAIMNEWIGSSISTSTTRCIHPSNSELLKHGLELISEIGIRRLYIHEDNGNLLEHPPIPLPSFKRPYLLTEVVFDGKIHPDLFCSLMNGTINLSTIFISLAALTHLRGTDLEHLNFPKLEYLTVDSLGDADDPILALPNLQTLLKKNYFRHLIYLDVEFPVEAFNDFETIKLVIRFIQVHSQLRKVFVQMIFPGRFVTADRMTFHQDELQEIINEMKMHRRWPPLKGLLITGKNIQEDYPQLRIWKEFIVQPSLLERLRLKIGPISNEILETVCSRNRSSLENLSINQYQDPFILRGNLDLRLFSSLQRIQSLNIRGTREISGIRHLPPTLNGSIVLDGSMSSDDLDHILLNPSNLKKLFIVDDCHGQDGCGVKMESLRKFVQIRCVKDFILETITVPFLKEYIPNGDPVNPTMLSVEFNVIVHWELNKDGYYINGAPIL